MHVPVLYMPAARDALVSIPAKFREQIVRRADALANDPFPTGWKKIQGESGVVYRVRQDSYRILYTVIGPQVTVVGVSARKEAYGKKGRRSRQ